MWKLCTGKHLCEVCKNFTSEAWLHFVKPLTYDHCICPDCAKEV
jgi:hypothetical protein